MSDLTLVLQEIGRGDAHASAKLLPLVYDELRRMAASRMAREAAGHTLQATALVHEAWLRLSGPGDQAGPAWQNRAHFFGAASQAMRRILIDKARQRSRLKRGGGAQQRVELDELDLAEAAPDEKLLLIHEALNALEIENPERGRVVVMKFFGGLTNNQVAESLGISERTVNRHWLCARTWLFLRLQKET